MPRIEIPVSDYHHSLFPMPQKGFSLIQVSSEKGKESGRLVLTSLIKVKFHFYEDEFVVRFPSLLSCERLVSNSWSEGVL